MAFRSLSAMSRTPRIPSLRRHKPSAQRVGTLNGKAQYLGRWLAVLTEGLTGYLWPVLRMLFRQEDH
jgi:hypothetical protein